MASNIHIGPAGWSYPDWNGVVYPPKQKKDFDPLAFIAFYFNLVEINSTFYRIPTPDTSRRWVRRVRTNPDFSFAVKAFRNFTHGKDPFSQSEFDAFKRAIAPIYEHGILGFVLIQFPWSLRFDGDARRLIDRLTSALTPFPVAVEIRHGSWAKTEAIEFLRNTGATLCGIDQPVIGNSITSKTHFAGPSGAYFRLHGRNAAKWFDRNATRDERYDYSYSSDELSSWSSKISKEATNNRTYVVLNNHFRGQAVVNALELKTLIFREKVPVPATLLRGIPHLREIAAEPDESAPDASSSRIQGELFSEGSMSQDEQE